MKIIGVIGIISVFVAIVVYSVLNLPINRALVDRIILDGDDPYLTCTYKFKDSNGKKQVVKGRVQIDPRWFPFDKVEYISMYRYLRICFKKGEDISKNNPELIEIQDEDARKILEKHLEEEKAKKEAKNG